MIVWKRFLSGLCVNSNALTWRYRENLANCCIDGLELNAGVVGPRSDVQNLMNQRSTLTQFKLIFRVHNR